MKFLIVFAIVLLCQHQTVHSTGFDGLKINRLLSNGTTIEQPLSEFIDEGKRDLVASNVLEEKAIMVMGLHGTDKTTLINYLCGGGGAETSMKSSTIYPTVYRSPGETFIYVDTPYLNSTLDLASDIAKSYFLSELTRNVTSMKFLLLVGADQNGGMQQMGMQLRDSIAAMSQVLDIFDDGVDALSKSIGIIISKLDTHSNDQVKDSLGFFIKDIIVHELSKTKNINNRLFSMFSVFEKVVANKQFEIWSNLNEQKLVILNMIDQKMDYINKDEVKLRRKLIDNDVSRLVGNIENKFDHLKTSLQNMLLSYVERKTKNNSLTANIESFLSFQKTLNDLKNISGTISNNVTIVNVDKILNTLNIGRKKDEKFVVENVALQDLVGNVKRLIPLLPDENIEHFLRRRIFDDVGLVKILENSTDTVNNVIRMFVEKTVYQFKNETQSRLFGNVKKYGKEVLNEQNDKQRIENAVVDFKNVTLIVLNETARLNATEQILKAIGNINREFWTSDDQKIVMEKFNFLNNILKALGEHLQQRYLNSSLFERKDLIRILFEMNGRLNHLLRTMSSQKNSDKCSKNKLNPGEFLANGAYLSSPNGKYAAVMQPDGNFVMYEGLFSRTVWRSDRKLWATNTSGSPNAYIQMQEDGNLLIYSSKLVKVLWESKTTSAFQKGKHLELRDDGKLFIAGELSKVVKILN